VDVTSGIVEVVLYGTIAYVRILFMLATVAMLSIQTNNSEEVAAVPIYTQ